MPAIAEKKQVLNNRGIVGVWKNGKSAGKYFYREKVKGRKAYRFIALPEANSLEEAENLAAEAAIKLNETPTPPVTPKIFDPLDLADKEHKNLKLRERILRAEKRQAKPKIEIEKAFKNWLEIQEKRVEGGEFAQSSYEHKLNCCSWIIKYFKHKKITITSQINESTFDDFNSFRLKSTDKRIVVQREISVLKEFFKKYLMKHN